MSERISYERIIKVFDDNRGWFVQVGPDGDGLELCSIAYHEGDSHDRSREIVIPWAHAAAVARAILELTNAKREVGGE